MNRLIRLLNLLLRSLLALAALLLVLLALYVSLGRELMPLLAEYKAEVQKEAQSLIGMPLRIGRLEGSWRDFGPLLVAHDVELGEGADRIFLQTLRVEPDLMVGLLERRLKIHRLELEGLRLSLLQSATGEWSVSGLPAASGSDPQNSLAGLTGISQLALLNSRISLLPHAAEPVSLAFVEFELRNGLRQRLDGRFNLPDGMPVSFSLRGRIDPANWRNSPAQLYLSLPQSDWAQYLAPDMLKGWQFAKFMAGGEFWATLQAGQLQRLVARLHAPQISMAAPERELAQAHDLAVTAYVDRQPQGYNLRLESLALSLAQTHFGPMQLQLQQRVAPGASAPSWQLLADRLDLAMLSSLAGSLAPAAPALDEWLGGLQPRGELRNLRANFDPKQTADDRLQFAANLDALGISPHAGVPGLENVSGSISGNLGQGALRLDAEDFVLYLQGIFPEPWKYAKAGGLLSWTLNDQALSLHSPFIRLDGEEGRIAGDLKIAIPFADDEFSYMDLRVGMTQGNAAFIAKYLPLPSANFSEGLAQWLKTAIVAGQIDEGIFIHQGTLSASAPEDSSTLSLYFRLNQLELAYQPDWPALREAEGEVFVEDNGVRVLVSSAVILDSQVSNIAAQVPPALRNQSLRLKLSADLQSSVRDALTILRTAPLELEQLFSGWQGEGDLFGKLSLEIPLSGPTPPLVVVDFATSDAQLRLPSPALQLSQINGAFRYNSAGGLSSPKFRARAFNQPVSGRIVTEGARGTTRTHIEANSKIALADLTRWLGLEGQVLPVEGVLPYKLTLTLDDHSHLLVESTLQGLSIELPAPFGKTAGAVRNSRLRMNLDDKDPVYRVSYADLASLALAMPGGKLDKARGELMLGGQPATLPAESGLTLQGSVSELDVSAWQALARRHAANAVSLDLGLLRPMQLQVGQFSGFGLNAENLGVRLQRDGAAWQVGLASAEVDGQITLPDQAGLPLLLDFKRLSLPEPPATDAEAVARPDPLDAFDPSSLPALDVQIAEVLLGGERLGGSAFKARPIAGGVEFSELDINLKGLKLTGAAGWLGRVGTTSSWYKGRIQGTDIGAVLQAWNFAPTATSKRFRVDADVRWPGSPAHVSLTRLSGSLDGRMNDGSFTQVKGGGVDALRAFGLLNLSAIGQRLRMDFSDTVGKGMGYERLSVVLQATNGVFVTRQPLEVKGPSAQLQMEGTLDMSAQQIDARLNVTLPVFNTATVAALIVGAPVVAGSIFVADKVAEKLFGVGASNLTRVQYQVKGPMADPAITFFKQ